MDKLVVFLAGAARFRKPNRRYIFTVGIDYNGGDILVTTTQYTGKYIMYTCNLAICYL